MGIGHTTWLSNRQKALQNSTVYYELDRGHI